MKKACEPSVDERGPVIVKGKIIEGYYITKTGQIWSVKYKKYLVPFNNGYYQAGITDKITKNHYTVKPHILVAKAFLTNERKCSDVNHKNGNKLDNRLENLEYVTSKENYKHVLDNNLRKAYKKSIIQFDKAGNKIAEYSSITEAAIAVNGKISPICAVCKGKNRTAFGFRWAYKEEETKLSTANKQWKAVRQIDQETKEIIAVYKSATEAAKVMGCHNSCISGAATGKYKNIKGFDWEYEPKEIIPIINNEPAEDERGLIEIDGKIFKNYYVTKDGKIWSKSLKIYRKLNVNSTGYYHLSLSDDATKSKITATVHRLVAKAFIPNPENLDIVNHKDGNKLNNHVSNLEWLSQSGNVKHARDNNLIKLHTKRVIQYDKSGKKIAQYNSIKSAAKDVGVTAVSISDVCRKKSQLSGEFMWIYEGDDEPGPYVRKPHYAIRKINQIDSKTKKIVAVHESLVSASKSVGTSTTSIRNSCKGENYIIKGFLWEYADN